MKGVIFDFNGTLFLDNDKHVQAWSDISRRLRNRPVTEQELHTQMNGLCNAEIVRYLLGHEDPRQEEAISSEKEALYRQYCRQDQKNFHLIAGAEVLFDRLKAENIPFTIASASIKDNIDFFVESFGLDRWIDPEAIVYDDGSYAGKREMFAQAARIIGIPLEEVTVIEDSRAGIRAAVACGVPDIRVINSANVKEEVQDIPAVRQITEDMTDIAV